MLSLVWVSIVTAPSLAEETKPNENTQPNSERLRSLEARLPAVDGINGKLAASASAGDVESYSINGSVSFPLGQSFGLQLDGVVSESDGGASGGILTYGLGAHAFWRDPSRGLFGFYGHIQQSDTAGGITNYTAAAETEIYWDRVTLSNLAGLNGFEDYGSDFFSLTNFAYYPTDNLQLGIGHGYSNGRHSLLLGSEWDIGPGRNRTTSLFANAVLPEGQDAVVNFGLRVYFGQKNKSLIRRHREDDPSEYLLGAVFLIALGYGAIVVGTVEGVYDVLCLDGRIGPVECYEIYSGN